MRDFEDRVAVVTGAGSGIGRALALRFAAEGMRVAIADVEKTALQATLAVLPEGSYGEVVDVGEESAVADFADHVFAELGAVHVLCNNAGVLVGGQMWTRTAADFEWVLRVNLHGMLHGVRAFVPRMIEQDAEGHIVNTCSVAGLFASPYMSPYTVSKFAVFGATQTLAYELQRTRLRVSALCPGGVATRINESGRNRPTGLPASPGEDQAFVEQVMNQAVTRGIAPEEVAETVLAAIRAERFLVLTHDDYGPALLTQARALANGMLPEVVFFERDH